MAADEFLYLGYSRSDKFQDVRNNETSIGAVVRTFRAQWGYDSCNARVINLREQTAVLDAYHRDPRASYRGAGLQRFLDDDVGAPDVQETLWREVSFVRMMGRPISFFVEVGPLHDDFLTEMLHLAENWCRLTLLGKTELLVPNRDIQLLAARHGWGSEALLAYMKWYAIQQKYGMWTVQRVSLLACEVFKVISKVLEKKDQGHLRDPQPSKCHFNLLQSLKLIYVQLLVRA